MRYKKARGLNHGIFYPGIILKCGFNIITLYLKVLFILSSTGW